MGQLDIATITGVLPKIFMRGSEIRPLSESRFLKEINQAKKTSRINPGGLFQTYAVSENYGAYGVAEGGAILGGSKPAYTLTEAQIRQLWKSLEWTGDLERIRDDMLNQMKHDPKYANQASDVLMQKAMNWAVADQVFSTFKDYARIENFFALQGGDNSAIGTVTAVNSGANTATFDGTTTAAGNRMFEIGVAAEFRSPGGVIRNATAAYFTVDQVVTHDSTGTVHFDDMGADVLVGDTAHYRNGYGKMPVGVPGYVDDTGDFKGVTRSDFPAIFESVMIHHQNSPTIAPIHVRTQLSYMQTKLGYDVTMKFVLWMCKAQKFNWETYCYDNLIRMVGAARPGMADYAIGNFEWDGNDLNIDRDVPPSALDILNMATWQKIERTPLQPYKFDSGQLVVSKINSDGERLDARMSAIFSESNWDLLDPRSNSIQDGFAFAFAHI